jgi:DNA repair protein RadA/Sms
VAAPMGAVAMGEIGLAGELRRVRDLPQRIAEAARLGFAVAVVPTERREPGVATVPRDVEGMRVIEVPDVASALRLLGVTRRAAEDFDDWDSGAEAV